MSWQLGQGGNKMVTTTFKEHELRLIIESLHECGKNKKCYGKTGFGKDTLKKVKCSTVQQFGLRNTRVLIPRAYKDCYGKGKRKT